MKTVLKPFLVFTLHTLQSKLRDSPASIFTTAPARPLLTPAAAQESLVGAPSGTPPRTRVDSVKKIAVPMVNGVAQRSKAGWRARR